MIERLTMLASVAVLGACAGPMAQEEAEFIERPAGGEGTCEVEAARSMVGQPATAETGARIRTLTGADRFRWAPPNGALTMDYRRNRVTVWYDRDMKITRIDCG